MPEECVLILDNMTLVPSPAFVVRICRLSSERMGDDCRALALASGCA